MSGRHLVWLDRRNRLCSLTMLRTEHGHLKRLQQSILMNMIEASIRRLTRDSRADKI